MDYLSSDPKNVVLYCGTFLLIKVLYGNRISTKYRYVAKVEDQVDENIVAKIKLLKFFVYSKLGGHHSLSSRTANRNFWRVRDMICIFKIG